jgi:hypothetical protein
VVQEKVNSYLSAKISDTIVLILILVLIVFGTEWGGFAVADRREARHLNVNQDQQRLMTENDDEADWGSTGSY